MTWKEQLWPVVCQYFEVDSSQAMQVGREYNLSIHTDLPPEKVFKGEPHRLGSTEHQRV